jgi:hypothetical protein
MRSRIRSTHIHDNDGKSDLHLFPVVSGGTADWARVAPLLRECSDQFPLLLEIKDPCGFPNPLEIVRTVFDRLELLGDSPQ